MLMSSSSFGRPLLVTVLVVITSTWLEAMIAVDQRDDAGANQFFERIVRDDPDIDTVQQASLETDKVILDMRRERRDLGLSCR